MITGVVIALLLLGVLLLLLEILFVPGTTIVGIGGLILLAIGIYLAYTYLGSLAGHISLASCVAAVFLSLIVLLKGQTWKKMALETNVEGKGVEQVEKMVAVGDEGKTVTRLNPSGNALFGDKLIEVDASGEFVDAESKIVVTKVEQNKIRVKTV
ncbi:MAG: membrane-bound ClpP family serine protease [Bacteroidia bacterium]|jgi:membrane-bound ClpP family serine protease